MKFHSDRMYRKMLEMDVIYVSFNSTKPGIPSDSNLHISHVWACHVTRLQQLPWLPWILSKILAIITQI